LLGEDFELISLIDVSGWDRLSINLLRWWHLAFQPPCALSKVVPLGWVRLSQPNCKKAGKPFRVTPRRTLCNASANLQKSWPEVWLVFFLPPKTSTLTWRQWRRHAVDV
jgi:hypothetical protein